MTTDTQKPKDFSTILAELAADREKVKALHDDLRDVAKAITNGAQDTLWMGDSKFPLGLPMTDGLADQPGAHPMNEREAMKPEIDRAAQALAEFREAGGLPWHKKMEIARENWRRAVLVVIEALETKS